VVDQVTALRAVDQESARVAMAEIEASTPATMETLEQAMVLVAVAVDLEQLMVILLELVPQVPKELFMFLEDFKEKKCQTLQY
jgi:hypothetical protein